MTINEIRRKTGMSQSQFAGYFGFTVRALQNWEQGVRKCPEYLLSLVQYKLEKEGIIKEGR